MIKEFTSLPSPKNSQVCSIPRATTVETEFSIRNQSHLTRYLFMPLTLEPACRTHVSPFQPCLDGNNVSWWCNICQQNYISITNNLASHMHIWKCMLNQLHALSVTIIIFVKLSSQENIVFSNLGFFQGHHQKKYHIIKLIFKIKK